MQDSSGTYLKTVIADVAYTGVKAFELAETKMAEIRDKSATLENTVTHQFMTSGTWILLLNYSLGGPNDI